MDGHIQGTERERKVAGSVPGQISRASLKKLSQPVLSTKFHNEKKALQAW